MHALMIHKLLAIAVAALIPSAALAAPVQAAPAPVVVWADATRAAALEKTFADGFRGTKVKIVTKDLAAIRSEIKTVAAADAPDVIWADAVWTGELVQANLVAPMPLSAKLRGQLRPNALQAFGYTGKTYGMPMWSQNLALVTNAKLVPQPVQTFAELSTKALKLKERGKIDVPLAVAQGAKGNAYFMQPLFSGLGGYVFGVDAAGNTNVTDVGINNPNFVKNAPLIRTWNKSGLINSSIDVEAARQAFVNGRAPFWITGQWSTADLQALKFKVFVSTVPNIVPGLVPAPWLGVMGFMVTTFAEQHGVQAEALSLVRRGLATAQVQSQIAGLSGRTPARTDATMSKLAQAFALAGSQAVPSPNVPQESVVWGPLGTAWVDATKGAGATAPKKAFAAAQEQVLAALQ